MKFIPLLAACVACTIVFSGCATAVITSETPAPSQSTVVKKNKNATEIVESLKESGIPIGEFITYYSDTDKNELLGTKDSYTSKANFALLTLEQDDPEDPRGGSIEFFNNNKDALARQAHYIKVGEEINQFARKTYVNGHVLLVLDRFITTDDFENYKQQLDKILE